MKSKYSFFTIITMAVVLFLTGCAKGPDITKEQNDIIAEYAASVLLKHSYDYQSRYEDLNPVNQFEYPTEVETESEPESETETQTPAIDPIDETTPYVEEPTTSDGRWNISSSLGLDSLQVKYTGYEIMDEYPKDAVFYIKADEGQTFVIMNFSLTNTGTEAVTVNNAGKNPAVKLYINDNKPVICYANLMLNNITSLTDVTIESQKSFDGIIVFMVPKEYVESVTKLKITYNDIDCVIK